MYVRTGGEIGGWLGLAEPQVDDAAKFQSIVASIQGQLKREFQDPNDPRLYLRRKELARLFGLIPPSFAKTLYDRLQSEDPLGRLFRYRLATSTRKQLLGILLSAPSVAPPKPQVGPAGPQPAPIKPQTPQASQHPAGMVRVPTADVMDKLESSATKQDSLAYGSLVDRILTKKQVSTTWWYEIEYAGQAKKGWVIGEKIAELAWPGDFTFTTPGSSGTWSPFEELRDAVRGKPVEDKVARAINNMNVQLLPMNDLTLGQFSAEAFYHALVSAKGNFKEACLILTAAVRAFKPDTKGLFRWVQQPEVHAKKFNYSAYADKLWHFFWNAYKRLDGTSAWTLKQLGLLYELKSRPNPIKSFFTLKDLDRDAKEDIAFNLGGIALAEWLNKNHPAVTQHHAAVIRDGFLQAASNMRLTESQKATIIQQLMEKDDVQVELKKRSYSDFAEAVEKHIEAALDAINRMGK